MHDNSKSCSGIPATPLELLLLGALRYLGRYWTFDDASESADVLISVQNYFFQKFVSCGSNNFYNRHVFAHMYQEDIYASEHESSGLAGACGSKDAFIIARKKESWKLRQQHKGCKQSLTARTISVTSTHRRRTTHVANGFPT